MMSKPSDFIAIYCQHCGFIDENVSLLAIETIRAIAQTEDATIKCKQCGGLIPVNFEKDALKVGKDGKFKLKKTTQW
jgi:uncharacterized Zn finger protein